MQTLSGETKVSYVEWAKFCIAQNVKEEELVAAARAMQEEFLNHQPGFISRQLLVLGASQYADLIVWQDPEAASRAMLVAKTCLSFQAYLGHLQISEPIAFGHPILQHNAPDRGITGLEFSLFKPKTGATEATLVEASSKMARQLYDGEPGFVEHMVVTDGSGRYADVVLAANAQCARQLCAKWGEQPFALACRDYLEVIDPSSVSLEFWTRLG